MEKEHFDDKILHIPMEIEHIQEAQNDIFHTEELAVDALNEHVIGYHNTEEESVTKIKHVPPNMENLKEVIDDSEHFTFCIFSETKHYIFLNLLLSIWTTHLDGKLHLNDLIWRTLETSKTRHTHKLHQNYTDNASRGQC